MKRFLFCIADTLTPKMRRSLKLIVKNNRIDNIKECCREKGYAFDMIPINKDNAYRLAVVLNQVKAVK